MNTDNRFSVILNEHDPKDIRSHCILRFFAEDLSENEKNDFVEALFNNGSWILPTEICNLSDSTELKNYTKGKFYEIISEWATKRIEFSNSLKNEIRNHFIPTYLLVEYREVLFSIRNLDFPDELMIVIQKLICDSNSNYLNNYFEVSFWLIVEDFSTDEIEVFFKYFSDLYVKTNSSNLKSFLYYFLNGLAYSSKIFMLSPDFTVTLRKLSESLEENNIQNDFTSIISILLIELIEKKELDLSENRFDKIIVDSLNTLKKGDPDNLDFYKFLKRFNYPFNNIDFSIEANTLFENIQSNIQLTSNNYDFRKKNSIAHHYIKSSEEYCELIFFYLEHCSEQSAYHLFILFLRQIDELRNSLTTLLWFDEYLNYKIIKGKIFGAIQEGFNVEIDQTFFKQRVLDKNLTDVCTNDFVLKNGYGFLNSKSLKYFPKESKFYNSGRYITHSNTKAILDAAKKSEPELFFISKVNYSSTNKWNVATLKPFNESFNNIVIKYELKALFSSVELLLIEKAHEYLDLESPFIKRVIVINKLPYFKFIQNYNIKFNENQFWSLLELHRPTLYRKIYLNHKKHEESFNKILNAYETNQVITGVITSTIKGGMSVDILGKEVFLPGSHIDIRSVSDFNVYLGQSMDFKVVKIDKRSKNVVVSHKKIIEETNEILNANIKSKLLKGQVLKGRVKNITAYGVFVDLGGIDGLIHMSDLIWGRLSHPNEVVSLDQEINVVILDFDKEKKRIALGLKQLSTNPWDNFDPNLKVGDKIKGKVVVMADYGAFVEIIQGVEGLIHITEISWEKYLCNVHDYLKIGKEVETKILILDRNERKLLLSIKQLTPDPWLDKYAVGTKHTATVLRFVNYGIFVELEKDVEGLIHVSKLPGINRYKPPQEFIKIGVTINVIVINMNKESRELGLGLVKRKSHRKRINKNI